MCVTGKLPAALNTQLEYVFYTWGNTQGLWVLLFCHHYYSLETLSATIKAVVSTY